MPARPVIAGRYFLPWGRLTHLQRRAALKQLTFKERTSQRTAQAIAEEDGETAAVTEVIQNEFHVKRFGASLPRSWAVQNLQFEANDTTTTMPHEISFPANIKPRDDQQSLFFHRLESEALKKGPQDILAIATTGSGKSVAGIHLGQLLGERTLIIVDQNKIAAGWIGKNFHKFYGEEWTNANVGRIQQDTCDFRGRAYSIAMAQTLARREYTPEFYRAFGLVIFDEVQVFGGPHFAKILGQFPARVRVGFTAEERSGAFRNVIRAHLGKPRVISKQEVLQANCYMLRNQIQKPFYCENDGSLTTGLSRVKDRNEKLCKLIKKRGFERGRNVLVLSDRTSHLVQLRRHCISIGIPEQDMGLHIGKYEADNYDVCYELPSGVVRKITTTDNRNEAAKLIRKLQKGDEAHLKLLPKAVYNRLQSEKNYVSFTARRTVFTPTQNELDHITNSCQIIFATYQIFSKGIDVPRLDMGVEALPSGNVRQPIGRILRIAPNKPIPEWYAIDDRVKPNPEHVRWVNILNNYFASKTKTRIAALERAKARISYQ